MTEQEYNSICTKMDVILAELGQEFYEDDPRIEQLLKLSDQADEYYKERHVEGYSDIELKLKIQLLVKIICMARELNLCTNEFIVKCLEAFVNQNVPKSAVVK